MRKVHANEVTCDFIGEGVPICPVCSIFSGDLSTNGSSFVPEKDWEHGDYDKSLGLEGLP